MLMLLAIIIHAICAAIDNIYGPNKLWVDFVLFGGNVIALVFIIIGFWLMFVGMLE